MRRFFHAVTVFQKSDANLTTNAPHRKPVSTEGVPTPAHSQAHAWGNKSVKSLTINQFVSKVSLNQVFHSVSFIIFFVFKKLFSLQVSETVGLSRKCCLQRM